MSKLCVRAFSISIDGYGAGSNQDLEHPLGGMIHTQSTASAIRPAWLLALVLWPALTGIPAYLGAFVAAAALLRFSRSPTNDSAVVERQHDRR